ncbi:5'-deoxyadenosine deaminase [Alicyclobacillus mali (ex Roth et al. 2021)]|uniref:5'-deoxyadenosine deaminase n=1 Tax=Alicyclobacillus mali (ex Roth et al. 2021) TaxID=1123961 RepID=UPI001A8F7182|nr:5'-deoxyadenosine deaminase [Alicyclobacillus mali (ex Roth et al. 2021)]
MRIWIHDVQIITMNARDEIVHGDLLIDGSRIAAVGDVGHPGDVDRVISAKGLVAMPGFVQTHVHLCQTLFRGMADDLELLDWLRTRIWPLEAAHDEESVYDSAMLGIGELIRSGTTTIVDMETVHHTEAAFHAIRETGIRAVSGKVMMDDGEGVPPGLQETTEASLEESVRLLEAWHGRDESRIRYAFCPRFVLSCTEPLLTAVRDLSLKYQVDVHTHAAENRDEIALVEASRGMRNVAYLDHLGLANERLILAHCVWLDEHERQILARRGVRVAHCPGSNCKLASGIADVPALLSSGCQTGLGADGAPCNNNLDMFHEMRYAAMLQKVTRGALALSARDVLRMATVGGAHVAGLASEIGSLEPGKLADIILLDLRDFHTYPSVGVDPVSRVVYSATRDNVVMSIIHGRIVMEGGVVLTLDRGDVLKRADRSAKRVMRRAFGETGVPSHAVQA